MPELPEVETTRKSLEPLLHQRLESVTVHHAGLRWPVPESIHSLEGHSLQAIQRRAKYLIFQLNHLQLLIHLGMSGSLRLTDPSEPKRKHDHLIFRFEQSELRFHDPRRFGCVLLHPSPLTQKLLGTLGPEPLEGGFDADHLWQQLQRRSASVKSVLMDNAVVVGVGNIYATEALFSASIHPARPANTVTLSEAQRLTDAIRQHLNTSIALGGSTLKDFVNARGENGYFQQTLSAYGRKGLPCMRCQTSLQELRIAQRASCFCPECQPLAIDSFIEK